MAWDDLPPDSAAQTAGWDAAPPTQDELPKWSDLPGNIIPNAEKVAKGAVDTGLRTAKGIYDLPSDALETAKGEWGHLLKGENPLEGITESPLAQDAKTVGSGVINTVKAMPGQLGDLASKEAWVNRPVENAMTAAALAGVAKGVVGRGGAMVSEAAKVAPAAEAAAEIPKVEPLVEMPKPAAPAGLPVMEPGAKTGAPHALFAYNDNFGPGGAKRSLYNVFGDPEHPAVKGIGHGSSVPQADLEKAGIPITGREPKSVGKYEPIQEPSQGPPPPPKPEAPPAAKDPLQDVKDFLKKTQGQVEAKPGWQEKAAKYVKNEVADLRAKDMGMRDPMIRSLDPKRPLEALQKAEDLMTYAGDQGYFKPGLTNIARKDAIAAKIGETGKNIGAVRQLGGQRATPPIADIRNTIKNELTNEYGQKAGKEIKTVLSDFDRKVKANPSFQGLSDVATYLNGEKKTFNKIGQNPGPTTDAANIISRMNNEALRKVLSPEEDKFYTQNLRDFGAHKKLEQMVASAARRGMTGRGAPGGALSALWQQLWDRGGYRMAGNVADRMSTGILKNPGKIKSIPEFFEELAHHTGEEIGDTIEGMYKGGRVPEDVRSYVGSHGC
jgi:hypothetical protein